jgi:hypothetical protein
MVGVRYKLVEVEAVGEAAGRRDDGMTAWME